MKKRFLLLAFASCVSVHIQAQSFFNGTVNTTSSIDRTGNVGLGTGATSELLTLSGNINFRGQTSYLQKGDISTGVFRMYPCGNSNIGPFLEMYGPSNNDKPGTFATGSYGTHGETWFTHYNTTTNSWDVQARITSDGRFLIGNVNPWTTTKYGLYVQDGILTEQVKVAVKTTNDWSDFVFKPSYKLMTLNDVELFVKKNMHLPNVPSAEDVVKDGVNMAQMDAKLLEKIEELTLYILQLNRELEALQEKISNLEKK